MPARHIIDQLPMGMRREAYPSDSSCSASMVLTCRSAKRSTEILASSSSSSRGEIRFFRSSVIGSSPCRTVCFSTARAKWTEIEGLRKAYRAT